jgi:hypothetical protein
MKKHSMNPAIVTPIIVASLTASLVLIATKHHMVSLITSLFATILVIFTLIPTERTGENTTYTYSSGGGVRVGSSPRIPKPPRNPGEKMKPQRSRPHVQVSPPNPPNSPAPPIPPPSSIPTCNDPVPPPSNKEMKDYIRNHGLYGVRGNLSCKHLQRGTVADKGLLQPLNARNQWVKFLSVDQLHAKDPHLIPRKNANQ